MKDAKDESTLIEKAISDSLWKIAKGNIGCLAAVMHVMNKYERFTFCIIVSLLLSNLRGYEIYLLYNDDCKRDLDLFFEKIMELNKE